MNRRSLIKAIVIACVSPFVPRLLEGAVKPTGFTIKNRNDGITTMALTDGDFQKLKAEIKLKYALSNRRPNGVYISLDKIKHIYYKK